MSALTGQLVKHAPHPVHELEVSSGWAGPPNMGLKTIASAVHESQQARHSIPEYVRHRLSISIEKENAG